LTNIAGKPVALKDSQPGEVSPHPCIKADHDQAWDTICNKDSAMSKRISQHILLVSVAAAVGALAASLVVMQQSDRRLPIQSESIAERLQRAGSGDLDSAQLAQVVESLVQVLDEEIAERRLLADQLEQSRAEMVDLQQNLRERVEEAFEMSEEDRIASEDSSRRRSGGPSRIDQRLAAAGFTAEEVEYLRRRQAEDQMLGIEFDDRARREGWIGTPRYAEEQAKLPSRGDTLRTELGDEKYDQYLYASGSPNRIAVANVIQTSPAEAAGLRPGDIIMQYGGEKIYSSQQLTELRSTGERGAPVAVDIIREGQLMRVTMPRGPMGIATEMTSVDPAAPGG
jgi:hypothetical protein